MSSATSVRFLRAISRALFWLCSGTVLYTWVLYPGVLGLAARAIRSRSTQPLSGTPSVSVLLVVHNEEAVIRDAIEDLLALDYPPEKVEYVVVGDGCTDGTLDIIRGFGEPRIRLYPTARVGLTAGIAYGVRAARNEVIVRTDADTRHRPDYLRCLLRHYADPRVGAVGGHFTFANADETGITRNEGLYWKFEMYLRKAESDAGILSTTSGAVMSFRRELFEEFSDKYSDDVVITKLVVKRGYRVVQEPGAIAYELMTPSIGGEYRARKRMVARGLTGIFSSEGGLNPVQHPGHWIGILSHKLLRWCTPFLMLGSFLSALGAGRRRLYQLAVLGHAALYSAALGGYCLEQRQRHFRPFSAAFSFCLANAGFAMGIVEAVRGRRISAYRSEK
ncbi:MAG: glycosyltransferase [Chloroflexota bacterium]|nr:glycosyltransferase [Chloroflexota bacterium]